MFLSCASTGLNIAGMDEPREEQIAWVRAVISYLGISATQLAKRAGIAPSTLQRPLNDPNYTGMLSGKVLSAVASVANLKPLEFPVRPIGLGEPEAVPFRHEETGSIADINVARAVKELTRGRNGRDPWVIRTTALELSGYMPGDVAIVDMNMQPRPRDIVCAQIYDYSRAKADTVFRVYEPPYLMTNSFRGGISKPVPVDGETVVIRGVVDGMFRPGRSAEH